MPGASEEYGAGWCGWRGVKEGERVRGEDRGGMGADDHSKNLDFDSE